MKNLKKVISLHQASNISGYHQDYLSALIRKGEIQGEKVGRNWVTTEDEIRNYMFKQKIRHKSWVARNLLFFCKKMNKSYMYAFACLAVFSVGIYFYNQKSFNNHVQTQARAETTEFSNFSNLETEEFKELKF